MRRPAPPPCRAGTLVLGLLVAACAPTPGPTPVVTPRPTSPPLPSRRPAVTPTPAATLDAFAGVLPLREDLRLPPGEHPIAPRSEPGMQPGVASAFQLGHCGVFSPVDLDGSLWEPVGGSDARGGAIDRDAEVGQIINATPGAAMLVSHDRLDWRATGRAGVVLVFRRIEGQRTYPGCS